MDIDFYCSLLGSATSGLVGRLICHPIDTCKAKIQFDDKSSRYFGQVLKRTLSTEGFGGLYRGIGAAVIGGVPGVCIYITTYEWFKTYTESKNLIHNEFTVYLLGGLVAEAACCLVFVPVDVVKERLQVQSIQTSMGSHPKYNGSFDGFRTIMRNEGIRGLYKGYVATMMSFGPFSAFYFLFFEETKKYIRRRSTTALDSSSTLSLFENLFCVFIDRYSYTYLKSSSSIAGGVASIITNPLDLVKLRLQVSRDKLNGGVSQIALHIFRQDGISGFFRGSAARVMYHVPSITITMTLFEEFRKAWSTVLR
eukprot:gene6067-8352_t